MSLLNRGTETVTVYPEEVTIDADGNTITRPSSVGVVCRAVVQPITSAVAGGNGETQDLGFTTEERLRLRLVGWKNNELGAQAQVEWQGRRYAIFGEPRRYNGSRRTAHVDYVMVRK
ncbi:hypothetical protein [Mycolicibacterium elephantis]